MKVEDQCAIFREILLAIFDMTGDSAVMKSKLFSGVCLNLPGTKNVIFNRNSLEERLPKENLKERICGDFDDAFLCLKPLDHGATIIPVLTMNYNFGRSIPEIRLRLGLYLEHDNQIKAVGYRFESPEGIGGRHHYYHVQMIQGFKSGVYFPPASSTNWLPDAEPTFPLDAEDSVDLILCLLLSLYGFNEFKQFIPNLTQSSRKVVLEKVSKLNISKFVGRKIISYWRVKMNGSEEIKYFETDYEEKKFRDYVRDTYINYRCEEIMPAEWERGRTNDRQSLSIDPNGRL